ALVQKGFENLQKHIENCKKFGITPVVALNHFYTDSEEELNFVKDKCKSMGVDAVLSKGWALGSKGTIALAEAVVNVIQKGENHYHPLYDWSLSIEEKIKIIATEIYGADDVQYSAKAKLQMRDFTKLGFDAFPICMAKTQKSLSDDERKIGRPMHFSITIREFEVAAGAGFVIPILGEMMRMPGLPAVPAAEGMDIDNEGRITGLS
ncbi:MAG TPA: formate--tetrahydrofolate ligase, partial [Saprospiraceae bacterium]|nr:formate--tetrahydrofolate ligase [Saprospiraceae bacterium]